MLPWFSGMYSVPAGSVVTSVSAGEGVANGAGGHTGGCSVEVQVGGAGRPGASWLKLPNRCTPATVTAESSL